MQLLFQIWTHLFYSLYLVSEEIMQVTGRRHCKSCFKSCRHVITLLQICFAYVGGSTRICFSILTVKIPIVEIMPLNGNRKKIYMCLKTSSDFMVMKSKAVWIRSSNVLCFLVFNSPIWVNDLLSTRYLDTFPCFSL